MNKRPICKECGARRAPEYRHRLSKSLVRGLRHFLEKHGMNEGEINDVRMTYSTRCNFQKLRYFTLIEKVGDPEGKGGKWKVTHSGFQFATGESEIVDVAITYRGNLVRRTGRIVQIHELLDGWTYRPKWMEEATKHEPDQGRLT